MRAGPASAGQADHRHHLVASGTRQQRPGLRHHRPAGVRGSAGARHLDSLPGHRDAAGRRRSRAVHGASGSQRRHQGRPLRPCHRRRGVRRVPRHRRRRRPTPRGSRGQLQHAAHLGQRRAGGRRLRRHPRRLRDARAREEASGRRDLHRPQGGRRAGPVRAHRRRHPIHHVADEAQTGRDGARRRLGAGFDRGARDSSTETREDGCRARGAASSAPA